MLYSAVMAFCPNCGTEIAKDAARCPSCAAKFGDDPAWQPFDVSALPKPRSRGACIAYAITKVVIAGLSLYVLGLAALLAHHEHGDRWAVINVLAMLGVIWAAIRTGLSWSFIVLFGSMLLFLTTCAANFHWEGR
ncbi:MAG: zinc-ribbon domain-containing protein [Usitatibacter sp.]